MGEIIMQIAAGNDQEPIRKRSGTDLGQISQAVG